MPVEQIFLQCVSAMRAGKLIRRAGSRDKEYHFQDWFEQRLSETGLSYEIAGRNAYPDFRLVEHTEGYELKALTYPGRVATFDSNSQMPAGYHNRRTIYYVFGRYPRDTDGDEFPVMDLVMCHGSFLNAHTDYTHQNKSVLGFGSYGDIRMRDRKMYVVPTPFDILDGLAHTRTLIVPADHSIGEQMAHVGEVVREEARELLASYAFRLSDNELSAEFAPNPHAGRAHRFHMWRDGGDGTTPVGLRSTADRASDTVDSDDRERA